MAKYTSYHLKGGQLFYSKTGKAVPAKHASKLTVDLVKKTVYRDGRKVGTLRQKTIGKKATKTIAKNLMRRARVATVDMDAVRATVKADTAKITVQSVIDRDAQSLINFNEAVDDLVRLGGLDAEEGKTMKDFYKMAGKDTRYVLWDEVHARYEEYGYQYETIGWAK